MQDNVKIVERSQLKDLKEHLDEKEITILLGPRQVGKTTLMLELKDYLIREKQKSKDDIYYFNLDLVTDFELFSSQPKFIEFLKDRTKNNKFIYIFIDEAQRIEEAGLFLKGAYDLNLPVKFILSGSSALELKKKTQEPLTGRKKVFRILPFSFEEFLNSKDSYISNIISTSETILENEMYKIKSYLNEYIIFGGYPRVVIEPQEEKKKELLAEIYNSYIDKDIIKFLNVKNPLPFSSFVKFLANQNGGLMNINEAADALNIDRRTIEKYLYYLEQTFVIRKITPFFTNAQKELVKMPKVYFLDTGIRNFAFSNFTEIEKRYDKGCLWENFALNEIALKIKMAEKINFWRSKDGHHEVDFIIRKGNEVIPVEIKTKENSLSLSYKSFLNHYAPKKGFIILSEGKEKKIKKDSSEIVFSLAYKTPFIEL